MIQRYERSKTGEYKDVYHVRIWFKAIEMSEISQKEIDLIFKSYQYNLRFLKDQKKYKQEVKEMIKIYSRTKNS